MSYEQIAIPTYDSIELEGRMYPAFHGGRNSGHAGFAGDVATRVAIIAHPYGFLGGSLHDHVVQTLKDTLCREGVPVLLYNSRGVGKSSGRASWTGEPERKDYQAVTDWLVNFKAKDILDFSGETKRTLEVFCCGYSYGSLMASCASLLPKNPVNPDLQVVLRYILISPPLSNFIGFLLTPFRSGQFMKALERIISRDAEQSSVISSGEAKARALIAYGTRDTFTQTETYRSQVQKLFAQPGVAANMVSVVEVRDADHFWSDPRCKSELMGAVSQWL